MKKVLLMAFAFGLTTCIFAQQQFTDNSPKFKDLGDWREKRGDNILRRDQSSGLYIPVNWAANASPNSANFQSFVSLVFPDSTVFDVTNTSDTDPTPIRFGHNDHSWGIILDPTDQFIQFDNNGLDVYTQHQAYTVDSIFFRYGYVRQVDSFDFGNGMEKIVDTMVIRLYSFNTAGLTTGTLTGGGNFGTVRSYSAALGYSPVAFRTIKIPIDNNDSTLRTANGWTSRVRTIPVDFDVPRASANLNNRLFGFTTHFIPAKPYAAGDTLIDFTDEQNIQIFNKNNYFVNSYLVDNNPQNQQVPSDAHLGNTLRLTRTSRYARNANGWLGYIPGNAFFNNQYLNAGFYIQTQNLSTQSLADLGVTVGNPYPNPTGQQVVNIPISTRSAMDVVVSVTDINGRTVYNSEININGQSQVSIDATGWASGIYNININIDGISTTKKLVVR